VPDYIRDVPLESKDGSLHISAIGFPAPNNKRQYSPALQRQISLLTADKSADYFLFDEADQPVRIVLFDMWTRLQFRQMRMGAWSENCSDGLMYTAVMAQHLVKHWGSQPGLSREGILRQFGLEYGEDVKGEIADLERKGVQRGLGEESFLDMTTRGIRSMPMP
jgi:hypothetical protein